MSLIGTAIADARKMTAAARPDESRAASSLESAVRSLAGGLGVFGRNVDSAGASEQYRHFAGWPHAIIRLIAQRMCNQPFRVARRVTEAEKRAGVHRKSLVPDRRYLPELIKSEADSLQIVERHPLAVAVADPNPIMVRWTLIYVSVCHLELTGRCHWWFYRNPNGRLEIWPVPSSWIEPVHTPAKLYASWEIRPPGGSLVTVPGAEVMYISYPDPADPFSSLSPLQAQARAVTADEAMQESQRRAFQRGVFPGVAVTIGKTADTEVTTGSRPVLTKEQRAQLIATIKAAYGGVMNADEPIILDGLVEKVEKITNTPREMDYQVSSGLSKDRLTQGWAVNPISMGQVENANRASSGVADMHLVGNVINPRLQLLSEAITAWMGPMFGDGDGIVAYFEQAVPIDPEQDAVNWSFAASQAAVSRNEIRHRLGLPPIQNGDTCVLNGSLVPILREDSVAPDPPSASEKSYGTDLWLRAFEINSDPFRLALRDYFDRLRDEAVAAAREAISGGARHDDQSAAFDPVARTAEIRSVASRHLARAAGVGAEVAWTDYAGGHAERPPLWVRRKAADWADTHAAEPFWAKIAETIYGELAAAAKDIGTIAAVESVLSPERNAVRAKTIAETETTAALNAGVKAAGHEAGRSGGE